MMNILLNIQKLVILKLVSNFSGSAGFALIMKKNKNYLFVDGRYTLQAKKQSGKILIFLKYHMYGLKIFLIKKHKSRLLALIRIYLHTIP